MTDGHNDIKSKAVWRTKLPRSLVESFMEQQRADKRDTLNEILDLIPEDSVNEAIPLLNKIMELCKEEERLK